MWWSMDVAAVLCQRVAGCFKIDLEGQSSSVPALPLPFALEESLTSSFVPFMSS